ncbi:uncharacterized protein CCOS01_16979 [Colletotrichum costaricense]|uniref:Uncharacterized protein n=1 Tax=Colletotrichum costaricense TaxID=1209916 RepID=A0AAI9YEJ6_9PEZI|nr:uncharacterized protein CCOS01_16979 [Colletotrichum costaricense]KAK1503904.1 hypothetical protein CCOS01_16979 [Colletotrichum costaricense]
MQIIQGWLHHTGTPAPAIDWSRSSRHGITLQMLAYSRRVWQPPIKKKTPLLRDKVLQANGHGITVKAHGGKSHVEVLAKGRDLQKVTMNLHTCCALESDQFTQSNGSAFLSTMRPAFGDHDENGSSNAEASTTDAADVLVLSGSTFNPVSNPKH